MGVDYTCYIGPYLKVKNPNKDTTETFRCCLTRPCKLYHREVGISVNFCPECGIKIGQHSRPTQTRIDFDYYSELNERMSEAMGEYRPSADRDSHYLISNIKGTPGTSFDPESDFLEQELTYQNSGTQIEEFKLCFAKEITYLEKKFGKSAITFHYGVLNWAW